MFRVHYRNTLKLALIIFMMTLLPGCDLFFNLPHSNPVDPDSPDYDGTPPVITVTSPQDGQKVKNPTQTIEGSVSDSIASASINLNGKTVSLSVKDKAFRQEVELSEGNNVIEVLAFNISMLGSSAINRGHPKQAI